MPTLHPVKDSYSSRKKLRERRSSNGWPSGCSFARKHSHIAMPAFQPTHELRLRKHDITCSQAHSCVPRKQQNLVCRRAWRTDAHLNAGMSVRIHELILSAAPARVTILYALRPLLTATGGPLQSRRKTGLYMRSCLCCRRGETFAREEEEHRQKEGHGHGDEPNEARQNKCEERLVSFKEIHKLDEVLKGF
jgi:hypothetical protein